MCLISSFFLRFLFFFFHDTATTEIYTLSLHDALPIFVGVPTVREPDGLALSSRNRYLSPDERTLALALSAALRAGTDRKSTRLNSSHQIISYAVFCLKKKKNNNKKVVKSEKHNT